MLAMKRLDVILDTSSNKAPFIEKIAQKRDFVLLMAKSPRRYTREKLSRSTHIFL
jgi:hypothetical protein